MGKTSIEWASDTLNPVRGCKVVSAGCASCYAMRLAATRLRQHPKYRGLATYDKRARWTGEVQLDIDVMREVLTWRKPRQCFLCDMSDLFYERVPFEFIDQVLAFVANAPAHRFYVLTKRADRMRDYFTSYGRGDSAHGMNVRGTAFRLGIDDKFRWPLPNLWLGVSAEDQATADGRIPELLGTPAAVRFVSYEPALGPLDFGLNLGVKLADGERWQGSKPVIDWVIAGAESGPGRRPASVEWVRRVRDQCAGAGAAFFLKQWPRGGGVRCVCECGPNHGGVCKLPLLDGVQHAAFPEATP